MADNVTIGQAATLKPLVVGSNPSAATAKLGDQKT
ncbi:hypothetical protein ES706_06368 [subsurface metagenome]